MDAVADKFSEKLNARYDCKKPINLSNLISWRGDTAKGYAKDPSNKIEDCRKSMIYLLSYESGYTDIYQLDADNRPFWFREFIDTQYEILLPLIEQAEKEVGLDINEFMANQS